MQYGGKMTHIDLYYNKEAHISRLLTGFHLLQNKGVFSIDFIENTDNHRHTPHPQVVEAVVNERIIAFDMCDAFALNNPKGQEYLSKVELYFKRSYAVDIDQGLSSEELSKIRPFGFDYYATYPKNPIDVHTNLISRCLKCAKDILGYNKCMYVDAFEGHADFKDNLSILFMTRLWDPNEISLEGNLSHELRAYREYMIEERIKINTDRIALVQNLRKLYGSAFFGGIQDSTFSRKKCPDLILPRFQIQKKAYLNRMKRSDICIGSTGLHKSIGWKTGKYVAAA